MSERSRWERACAESGAASKGFAVGGAVAVVKIGCFADVLVADVDRDGVCALDAPAASVVPRLQWRGSG